MGSAGDASQISCSRPDGAVSVLMSATGAVHMRFSRGCADVGLGVGCVRMIRMAMFMTVPMPMPMVATLPRRHAAVLAQSGRAMPPLMD